MAAEDACEGLAPTDPGAEQAALRPHRQGHHGMSPRGAPSLLGVHGRFRTVPTGAHPLCPAGLGLLVLALLGSKLTAGGSGPGFGCSQRLPPAQFLPPDSTRRDGAGLIPRTRGGTRPRSASPLQAVTRGFPPK